MKFKLLVFTIFLLAAYSCSPGVKVESTSTGEPRKGKLTNAWRLPRKDTSLLYFSRFSYYILGNAHLNSRVYRSVLSTCRELHKSYPDRKFIVMECSNKKGGKMILHRTHQNGLSVDFMTPLLKKNKKPKYYRGLGIFRYLLNFDDSGVCNAGSKVTIDFNTMADHLLTLDKYARKNGLRIKRVIFKIELKDELFTTPKGKLLAGKGITFAQGLSKMVNNAHDDHYHVNFEVVP